MNNKNRNNDVVIDLSNYTMDNTTLTSRNEIIHLEQLDEVCSIIKEKIEFARDYNPNKPDGFISLNDVISILARRGAGKTTFVKSLVHLIRTSPEDTFQKLRKELCCVDVFEPNQMMNKENLLIRFLAQINEIFQEKKCCNLDDKDNQVRLKNVRRKLYEALPVIDGVGKSNLFPDWDDNAYIADRYMNLASNVKDLEKRFHHYIHTGLDIIRKKAILFVLDDSDVNIEKSFEILEIIRLFFTSPQIIVVLTGDASLYSMAVRRNYWQYFTKAFLEKECDALDRTCTKFHEYQKMVYRLEAQYLQKMIKANHRIFLNNVYDKIHLNNLKNKPSNIYIKINKTDKEIYALYQEIFDELALKKELGSIQDKYINHFLAQPFRNQLRLFSVYANYQKLDKKNSEIFTKGLLKVFEVYINQLSGDSKYLMAHSPIYPAWLLKFLVENNILNIGSSFLPEMESDSLKNVVSVLGLSCYEQIKHNPSIIFDFWIRISLTKQLSALLGEDIITKRETNLLTHSKLYTDKGLDTILSNMLTFCRNRQTNGSIAKSSIPGTIIRKGIYYSPNSENKLLLEGKLIDLLQVESVASNQKTVFIYSIYRPLAVLGELLRLVSSKKSSEKQLNLFKNLFDQLAQVKLYPEPDVNIIGIKGTFSFEKINITTYLTQFGSNITSEFLNDLLKWANMNDKLLVAPFFIDRIFNRYFDLMISASQSFDNNITLGNFINDSVLALWNAAIVEKLLLVGEMVNTSQDYETEILNVFFQNYIIYNSKWRKDPSSKFVNWLLNCPLLKAYTDPFIQEIIEKINDDKIGNIDIWSILRKHRFIQKQELNQKKIHESENTIIQLEIQIKKIETYININNRFHIVNNYIDIYENELKRGEILFNQKIDYQNQLEKLTNERTELRKELLKTGFYNNQTDLEYELGELYKKLNEESKLKENLESFTEKNTAIYGEKDELYNEIEAKSADIISVHPILNNL